MDRDLVLLTASELSFDLATNLVNIFGIIFLYNKLGNSFILAAIPFALLHLFHATLLPRLTKIVCRIGFKQSIYISMIFYILAGLVMYFYANMINWPILILWSFLFALGNIFYYIPTMYILGKRTDHIHRGKVFGLRKVLFILSHIILPILGGLVSQYFGLSGLMLICIIFYIISVIPITKLADYNIKKFATPEKTIHTKHGRKIAFLQVTSVIAHDLNNFWPLFVFLLLGSSYVEVGIIFTAVNLLTIVLTYIVGREIDSHDRINVYDLATSLGPLAWLIRVFSFNYISIFITDTIFKLSDTLRDSIMDVIDYDLMNSVAREETKIGLILLSETAINYAIAFAYIFYAALITYAGFQGSFVITAIIGFIVTKITVTVLRKNHQTQQSPTAIINQG